MDLSSLNTPQQQAVTAPLGPVLVLAGAGSGKTRALAYRIAYLCEQGMIPSGNILALTFTNKAAKEMAERVNKLLVGPNLTSLPDRQAGSILHLQSPLMGTFHSICAKILRKEIYNLGYSAGFTIYDSDDQGKVIKDILADLHVDKRFSPSFFRNCISNAKNVLQTPAEFNIGLEPDLQNLVGEVYGRYQNFLFKQNAVDFDDLLMLTVKIFESVPRVLEHYQKLFAYILVDEYQDTNHAQYVFLHLLAHKHHNLFVVGDDAQSIYGFRGSNIRNILNFEAGFPEAVVIKLEQNYRSSKNILAAAQKVIELNSEQKHKKLWTENDDGRKIIVAEQDDETEEARFVAKTIVRAATLRDGDELEYEAEEEEAPAFSILDHFLKKTKHRNIGSPLLPQLPKEHGDLGRFAVLFRTHAQSRALEEVFIESGVPYQIIGGLRFYERKEIKDIIAYIRLALNYRDVLSLKRVINEPARGIGEKSMDIIRNMIMKESVAEVVGKKGHTIEAFRSELAEVKFGPKIAAAVDTFFLLLNVLQQLPEEEALPSLVRLILKRTGYEAWVKDGTEMGETRWENVQELLSVTEKYKGMPWKTGAEEFLEEVALIIDIEDEAEKNKKGGSVTLMTLHSAKGLEFDTVFLVGLEEGVLPHSRSLLSPSELSEEVRLAYVGLTRARHELYLTYARRRRGFGSTQYNQPSRILKALPQSAIEFKGTPLRSGSEEGYSYERDKDVEELDF